MSENNLRHIYDTINKDYPQYSSEFGDYDRGTDWRRVCISKLLGDADEIEI